MGRRKAALATRTAGPSVESVRISRTSTTRACWRNAAGHRLALPDTDSRLGERLV